MEHVFNQISFEVAIAGVRFHVAECGAGTPLVLLHGFTGSGESWWPVLDRLASRRRVFAVDLIGHGRSDAPIDAGRYAFTRAVDDLAALADTLGTGPATWLGYSLGGRLALGLALRHPDLVSALILESASPGIVHATARAARREADAALAASIEHDGIAGFVEEWELLPLWSSQQSLTVDARDRQRAIRFGNRPAGLANSLRGMGQGSQPDFWDRLGAIAVPALIVAGEEDRKFATIAERMAAAIPAASLAIVPGAGHTAHLEQPAAYADLVTRFLRDNDRNGSAEIEEQCA